MLERTSAFLASLGRPLAAERGVVRRLGRQWSSSERFRVPGYPRKRLGRRRPEMSVGCGSVLAVAMGLWSMAFLLAGFPAGLCGIFGVALEAAFVLGAFKLPTRGVRALTYGLPSIAMLLFFVFMFHSLQSGGDALNGRVAGGIYYVASHGHSTAVSRSRYLLSAVLGVATFSLWPSIFAVPLVNAIVRDRSRRPPDAHPLVAVDADLGVRPNRRQ